MTTTGVDELRVVVTIDAFDDALHLYRDVLGMAELPVEGSADGRVVLLDAGRATLELADPAHAAYVDEVEVGRRVAGPIRIALRVGDAIGATRSLAAAGARVVAEPTPTPWGSHNARLEAVGVQLTLFTDDADGR